MSPLRHRLAMAATALASTILGVGLAVGTPATAAEPDGHTGPPASLAECSTTYFHDDWRLGPEHLPRPGFSAVGNEVLLYQRTGHESPRQFLKEYYDTSANGGKGGWKYPPADGYALDQNGQPEEAPITLNPGQKIDRFGSEYGSFLAPAGTPYAQRSIPPSSLNTSDPAYTCNYHVYRVAKQFTVESGPIAAWFGQPGGGRQYQLKADLLPGTPTTANVRWLIDNGYLERVS